MPILDKTINTPALANGDAQVGLDEDETLPYTNSVGSHATPTMSPTNQVSALSIGCFTFISSHHSASIVSVPVSEHYRELKIENQ